VSPAPKVEAQQRESNAHGDFGSTFNLEMQNVPVVEQVVTASQDRTARMWDAESGRAVATLTRQQGSVHAAAFSPDGKRVVTASGGQTALSTL
jgi:WD40 repeat protein